jgi:hypothetical protein
VREEIQRAAEDVGRAVERLAELVQALPVGSPTRADLECILADRLRPAEAELRRGTGRRPTKPSII